MPDLPKLKFIPDCDIKKLKPYKRNPRENDQAVEAVAKSIEEFGFNSPIIVNEDYEICVGHTRVKAAIQNKITKVPVIVAPHLVGDKFKGYNIADNQTATIADWNDIGLAEILKELENSEFDMSALGFDGNELEEIMAGLDEQDLSEGLTDPDDVPEMPDEAETQPGDIWLLGRHRLMCGDATNRNDVEKLMDGNKADMVFTDPPYNVDYGASKNPRHKIRKIINDKQSVDEWESFCKSLYALLKEYNRGDIYLWGASGYDGMKQRLLLVEAGCHWSATIIWKKQQLVLSPANYQRIYEPCFYGWFDKSSFVADRKQVEVWEIDRPLKSDLHPTMKPVELCVEGIRNSSRKDSMVLDLFLSSGSTLIACEQLSRKCYGMEIDPIYCDVIVKRWEDFTGMKAERVPGTAKSES